MSDFEMQRQRAHAALDAMRAKMAADAEKAANPPAAAKAANTDVGAGTLSPGTQSYIDGYGRIPEAQWNAPVEGDHRFEEMMSPAAAAYARSLKIPGAA